MLFEVVAAGSYEELTQGDGPVSKMIVAHATEAAPSPRESLSVSTPGTPGTKLVSADAAVTPGPRSAGSGGVGSKQVSFQWKNPDFLFKNPDFLSRNPDFLLKIVDFII